MDNNNDNFDLNSKSQNPYSYQESDMEHQTLAPDRMVPEDMDYFNQMPNGNMGYPPQMPNGSMGYPPQMPNGGMGYPPQMSYGGMGYPNQIPYAPYGKMKVYDPGKGKGIASMILGIASIITVCSVYGIISFICGIIGLVLSKLSEKASGLQRNGFATAGLICSIIGIAISLLWFILFAFVFHLAWINAR